jgi:nuclease S1
VAAIAVQELSPAARAQVTALLGSDAMLVHESNWADEVREQRPETGPWHYVDIPLPAKGYEPARDCAAGNCVVAEIDNARRVLGDPRSSQGARQGALRFLIHLVADVHQPLHTEDNQDHGGNAVHVSWMGERTNLHHVWDTQVVETLGSNVERIAADLEHGVTPDTRKAWAAGTPADWANETHALARDVIYPRFHGAMVARLPPDYPQDMAPVTRLQLARAGVRLAWLLNTTLK